jgi:hypothetical protein
VDLVKAAEIPANRAAIVRPSFIVFFLYCVLLLLRAKHDEMMDSSIILE